MSHQASVESEAKNTPMSRSAYVRGLTSYYVADIIRFLTTFLLGPWLLYHLGDDLYGVRSVLASLLAYVGLLDLGVGQVVTRYLAAARGAPEQQGITGTLASAFWSFAGLGLLGFVTLGICSWKLALLFPHLPAHTHHAARMYVALMGLNFAIALPASIFGGAIFAYERPDLANALGTILGLVNALFSFLAVYWGLGLVGLGVVTIASSLFGAFTSYRLARKVLPAFSLRFMHATWTKAKELLRYGSNFLITNLAVLLVFQTDALVISHGVGTSAVAVYSFVAAGCQQLMQVVFKITDTLYPSFARLKAAGEEELLAQSFLKSLRYSCLVGGLFSTAFIVIGDDIFAVWLGREIRDQIWVIRSFGALIFVHCVVHACGMFVAATGALGRIARFSILEGVLNLGLSILLVGPYGVQGVAIATLVAQVGTVFWINPWFAGEQAKHLEGRVLGTTIFAATVGTAFSSLGFFQIRVHLLDGLHRGSRVGILVSLFTILVLISIRSERWARARVVPMT